MADFAAVLRKAVEALKENTPEAREKIYAKARATIETKLAAVSSPPQVAERQRQLLDEAITTVEAEYAPPAPEPVQTELDDEFESLLSDLQFTQRRSAPVVRPIAGEPEEAPAPEPEAVAEPDWSEDHAPSAEPEAAEPEVEPASIDPAPPLVATATPSAEEAGAVIEDVDWSQTREVTVEGPEALPPFDRPVPDEIAASTTPQKRRGGIGKMVPLVLLLLVVCGAAVAGWVYRDEAARLAGLSGLDEPVAGASGGTEAVAENGGSDQVAVALPEQPAEEQPTAEAQAAPETPAEQPPQKFTQRLLPDGSEVDEGPAGGEPGLGEGTSVAQVTQGTGGPVQSGQAGEAQSQDAEGAVPVGQKAIFYEERTSASEGYAEGGSVVWSVINESAGENQPSEPAIQAEATIPEKGLQLRMTIRRNSDQSLPASHIVELIFLTPENFPGGGISNVLRINMKRSEQDTGSPLLGIPAKIADGFFLVALSDTQGDQRINSTLLRRQNWIDIPIVYTSGRRALITLEKGLPGERIFNEALDAWSRAAESSG